MIEGGIVRVIQDRNRYAVVWNAVDPMTGSFVVDNFSVSAFSVISGNVVDFSCDNCGTFANSLLNPQMEAVGGICPHKFLTSRLLEIYHSSTTSWPNDAFNHFLSAQVRKGSGCELLGKLSHLKYFVLVSTADARAQRTTEHSVCLLRPVDGLPWVKCNEMRCTKGKMKRLKRTTSLGELCIHLVTLLQDNGCKEELKERGVEMKLTQADVRLSNEADTNDTSAEGSDSDDDDAQDVYFDVASAVWKPKSPVTFPPIPQEPNEYIDSCIQRRKCGDGFLRSEDGTLFFSEDGYLTGPPCIPLVLTCEFCQKDLNEVELEFVRVFKLRTYLGCAQRSQFVKKCPCGHVHCWDPILECIHVINGGKEGG
jgi:hypothetical protein